MKPVATLDETSLRPRRRGWPRIPGQHIRPHSGAAIDPDAPALSFFLKAESLREAEVWTYRELLGRITQTANAFHALGVGKDDVVSFLLPNLPETHFTIWGGQAAGIVAAFNPLRTGGHGDAACRRPDQGPGHAGAVSGDRPWSRLAAGAGDGGQPGARGAGQSGRPGARPAQAMARRLQAREVETLCGPDGIRGKVPPHIGVHDFWSIVGTQPDDRLISGRRISPGNRSSFFCTGGTTGLPKIAMRSHGNEVANAVSVGRFLGDAIGPGKTLFCGLPLFHVNGALVTGSCRSRKAPMSCWARRRVSRRRGRGALLGHRRALQDQLLQRRTDLYAALMPVAGRDVSSLEYGLCGAAPMPVEVFRGFQERTGLKILEGTG